MITLIGTTSKKLQQYVDNISYNLNLKSYNTLIDIKLQKKCDFDFNGWCVGDTDLIEIEISRSQRNIKLSQKEIMISLAHEMVHAQQIASGRMVDKHNRIQFDGEYYFKNSIAYKDMPWEIEAYALEEIVYLENNC